MIRQVSGGAWNLLRIFSTVGLLKLWECNRGPNRRKDKPNNQATVRRGIPNAVARPLATIEGNGGRHLMETGPRTRLVIACSLFGLCPGTQVRRRGVEKKPIQDGVLTTHLVDSDSNRAVTSQN